MGAVQSQSNSQRACRTTLRGVAWKADISLAAHGVDRLEAAKDKTLGIERNFTRNLQTLVLVHFCFLPPHSLPICDRPPSFPPARESRILRCTWLRFLGMFCDHSKARRDQTPASGSGQAWRGELTETGQHPPLSISCCPARRSVRLPLPKFLSHRRQTRRTSLCLIVNLLHQQR